MKPLFAHAYTDPRTLPIEPLDERIAPLEREPRQAARDDQRVVLLETIPGVGDLLGPTPASEIGDVARFATARKPIGYAGLAPRVHQSGERSHTGALSKPGSRTLRWAAVEATHAARRPTNPWHELNSDIAKRTGKNPAKSAVAPKILIARWHIPGRQQPSKPARPQTSGTTEISASSRCLLAARRPRTELRSRASSHQQSAHQAPKEK